MSAASSGDTPVCVQGGAEVDVTAAELEEPATAEDAGAADDAGATDEEEELSLIHI